ncbi:MAG: hypothetical protein M3Q91_10640, partial [Acidobacteriota bacterium]|nr:hypothetical protein [Acidobacteriota bacterium]
AVRFAVAVRTCALSRLARNGHMLVVQITYLNLTHAAKARVDRLLITQPGERQLFTSAPAPSGPGTCERVYDPVTIALDGRLPGRLAGR